MSATYGLSGSITLALEAESLDHVVYRLFDASGLLLYVGIASDVHAAARRWAWHRRRQTWGDDIAAFTRTEAVGSLTDARAVEAVAVRLEWPLWNTEHARPEQGAKGSAQRRAGQLALPAEHRASTTPEVGQALADERSTLAHRDRLREFVDRSIDITAGAGRRRRTGEATPVKLPLPRYEREVI